MLGTNISWFHENAYILWQVGKQCKFQKHIHSNQNVNYKIIYCSSMERSNEIVIFVKFHLMPKKLSVWNCFYIILSSYVIKM